MLEEQIPDSRFIQDNKLTDLTLGICLISGIIIGFILGFLSLPYSDIVTVFFTIILGYFSWVQMESNKLRVKIANFQYALSLEQSYGTLITEVDMETQTHILLKNVGNRTVHDIELTLYNENLDEEYPYEAIEEIYARSVVREYLPDHWLPLENNSLSIIISYEVDEDQLTRMYTDEIQFRG